MKLEDLPSETEKPPKTFYFAHFQSVKVEKGCFNTRHRQKCVSLRKKQGEKAKKMAQVKIYNDITSEEDKIFYQWFGMEAVCYKDIDTFCSSIPEDDDEIDIRLFCNGGSVMEGWAMYDRLRATGKTIHVTVEGKAASMATVLLMAAPKENRHAYENASICVHNPWLQGYHLGACTAEDLRKVAESLQREQDKILDLYVERCGCDREKMQKLMDEDKWINVDEAKEMGIIGNVLPPISASKRDDIFNNINIQPRMDMAENNEGMAQVKQKWLDKVLSFFGKKSVDEVLIDIELNTADGQKITVERDEGEPQVGDKASPDGNWKMPDGKTIVIDGGVITEILDAEGDGSTGSSGDGKGEPSPQDKLVAALQQQVADLTKERDGLQARLDEATKNIKSEEEEKVLEAVKLAGGIDALQRIQSNYKPAGRTPDGSSAQTKATSREEGKQAILEKMAEAKKRKGGGKRCK